jgi:hypothetical protein
MRTVNEGAMVLVVDAKRKRLTVELESDTEPIAGEIAEPGGKAHAFTGYMDLISTLEQLRLTPPAPPVPRRPGEGK